MTTPTRIVRIDVLGHRTEVLLEIDRNEVWLALETYNGTLLSVPLDDAQLSRLGQAVEAARQLLRFARKPAEGQPAPAGGAADPPGVAGALEAANVAPGPSATLAAKDQAVLDATRDAHIRVVAGHAFMTADSADNIVHAELLRRGEWPHDNG